MIDHEYIDRYINAGEIQQVVMLMEKSFNGKATCTRKQKQKTPP